MKDYRPDRRKRPGAPSNVFRIAVALSRLSDSPLGAKSHLMVESNQISAMSWEES